MVAGAPLSQLDSTAAPWLRWRHQAVRDLAWALASPPLLQPAGSHDDARWLGQTWCDRALSASLDWLATLDADPTDLLAHLAREHDHRLGSHFESLLAFWLSWPGNPHYELVARNLPVRAEGRTLGEFDFLVRERGSGEWQHWEVAVKFFLGVQPGGQARHWIGPGLRDRLDLKLERLRTHQLRLALGPAGRRVLAEHGLPSARPVCLVKGCLFYPADAAVADWAPRDAATGHLQGWWQDHAGFLARWGDTGLDWLRLPKANWMTAVLADASMAQPAQPQDIRALLAGLPVAGGRSAVCVIGLRDGREVTRGFVVPAGWPLSR